MPDIYEVIDAGAYWPNPDTPCWYVDMRKPDGGTHRMVFPVQTLAWRAAEYGLDPDDTEALLDVVLHEPFAPSPDDPLTAASDPVLQAGLLSPARVSRGTVRAGEPVPTTLYTAETTEQARTAHLMRIQHAKDEVVRVIAPKGRNNPLAVITGDRIDHTAVAMLAARVDANRRLLRAESTLPAPPHDPGVDRRLEEMGRNPKEATRA